MVGSTLRRRARARSRRPFTLALAVTSAAALAVSLVPAAGAQAATGTAALTSSDTRTVSFRGVSVTVPAAWPVRRMSGQPGCVRFDEHAVYLGDPSRSTCPSDLVGRTESVHLTTGSLQGVISPDRVVTAADSPVGVVVSAGDDTAAAREIASSVTYGDQPAEVTAPSGRSDARTFAATADSSSATSTSSAKAPAAQSAPSSTSAHSASSSAASPSDTTYTGLGFDACQAQPLSTMATWFAASPYKAANMYIGGASRGCSQPNLTADWVTQTIAQGWTLIPTYVGLQAPCVAQKSIVNRIDPAQAPAQGAAAADDAVAQMAALGLPVGNPIYFDMEGFATTQANAGCTAAAQAFLDQWTARLHARGYVSGVYTSAGTVGALLVARQGDATFHQPDDLWFARWPSDSKTQPGDPTLSDPAVPAQYWANHQRIHQYRGGHNESYGGVTVNIDSDSVDAAVSPSQLAADGAFVTIAGQPGTYRIAGGAPIIVTSWDAVGGQQPVNTLSQSQFNSLPDRPENGTFLQSGATGRIWRVVKGVATYVPSWTPYGGPKPSIVVDQAALDNAGTGGVWNLLTSGTPAPRMTGPSVLGTIATKSRFGWFGGYSSSAVATYDVRWQRARWDGTYGPWTSPASWKRTPVTDVPLGLHAGYTSCVSVRARNRAGQLSGWTTPRCLARALDDKRLSVTSSGWQRKSAATFLNGSALSTTRKGATLSLSGARVKRVGVVATTCATCGRVAVFADGKRIGTINLQASSRHRRQVRMLPAFTRGKHTIKLRVPAGGQTVQIDGIVLNRS
jgi:hypothetical protein